GRADSRWKRFEGLGKCAATIAFGVVSLANPVNADELQKLAEEVRDQGWICYSARTQRGDWDLFACRPDGSSIRQLTNTAGWNEFYPQFTRAGDKLLYRRIPAAESIDGNRYGAQGEL